MAVVVVVVEIAALAIAIRVVVMSHLAVIAIPVALIIHPAFYSAARSTAIPRRADESNSPDATYSGYPRDTNIRLPRNNRGPVS